MAQPHPHAVQAQLAGTVDAAGHEEVVQLVGAKLKVHLGDRARGRPIQVDHHIGGRRRIGRCKEQTDHQPGHHLAGAHQATRRSPWHWDESASRAPGRVCGPLLGCGGYDRPKSSRSS